MKETDNNGKPNWRENVRLDENPLSVTHVSVNHNGSTTVVETSCQDLWEVLKELEEEGSFTTRGAQIRDPVEGRKGLSADDLEERYSGEPIIQLIGEIPSELLYAALKEDYRPQDG